MQALISSAVVSLAGLSMLISLPASGDVHSDFFSQEGINKNALYKCFNRFDDSSGNIWQYETDFFSLGSSQSSIKVTRTTKSGKKDDFGWTSVSQIEPGKYRADGRIEFSLVEKPNGDPTIVVRHISINGEAKSANGFCKSQTSPGGNPLPVIVPSTHENIDVSSPENVSLLSGTWKAVGNVSGVPDEVTFVTYSLGRNGGSVRSFRKTDPILKWGLRDSTLGVPDAWKFATTLLGGFQMLGQLGSVIQGANRENYEPVLISVARRDTLQGTGVPAGFFENSCGGTSTRGRILKII